MTRIFLLAAASLLFAAQASAQSTSGTLLVVPATGEVVRANDLATLTFGVEEQDADKARAASRANQKMKEGLAILRAADPHASLKSQGYTTYPVYAEQARPLASGSTGPKPTIVGWRVGQTVQMKTTDLASLPKTAAAAQSVLALRQVGFGLTPATLKKADEERIATTYANLRERIAFTAAAMGRSPADAVLDTVDLEGTGGQFVQVTGSSSQMNYARAAAPAQVEVAEPSFEPGETTLQMKVVGKVRFK
ncbi:MAG: SIMPL domain-containing protein [Massilia sp.]